MTGEAEQLGRVPHGMKIWGVSNGNPPEKPPVLHFSLGFSPSSYIQRAGGTTMTLETPEKIQIIQCRAGDFRSPEGSTMARWQLEDITDGKNEYEISDDQNPSIKRI